MGNTAGGAPPERWESRAIKVKQTQTNKESVLKVKGVHGWCPAASSFSSGSFHFKGTLLLGYASLMVHLYCGSSLWNEADLGTSMYVSSSLWIWIFQCVATGWQADFLWDWPSPHSCYVYHVCITKSEHPCLYYLLHFFVFFILRSLKRLFQKMTKLFCGLHQFWN